MLALLAYVGVKKAFRDLEERLILIASKTLMTRSNPENDVAHRFGSARRCKGTARLARTCQAALS
jgi:hypothetical protein